MYDSIEDNTILSNECGKKKKKGNIKPIWENVKRAYIVYSTNITWKVQ